MATIHTNTGTDLSGTAHNMSRGTAASIPNADGGTQNRTLLWVVGGVILLSVIIWFATRDNNAGDMDQMNLRNSEQVAP